MLANPAQRRIEPIPAPRPSRSRAPVLRPVPERESGSAPRASAETTTPVEPNALVTFARELAAVAGLLLWLGGCLLAASMVV